MPEPPRRKGQALVEFAISLPILVLLVAGVVELGRGYSYAMAMSDAARDGARYVAGKTATTNGPGLVGPPPAGLVGMCNLIKADLAATTTNVVCPIVEAGPAPFPSPATAGGQAVVAVWCGGTLPACRGSTSRQYRATIDVYVYYGFNDLNILGGPIKLSGSSRETTSW